MEEWDSVKEIMKFFGVKNKDFNNDLMKKIYLDKNLNLQSYSVKKWRETYKKKRKLSYTQESLQSAFQKLREFDQVHERKLLRQGKIAKIKTDRDTLFDCIQYMPPNWVLQVQAIQFNRETCTKMLIYF